MFDLSAHVLGDQRSVSAELTDLGIIVTTGEGDRRRFRSISEALSFVHRYLGEFLKRAQRPGIPWGLSVSVAGLSATYGDMSYFGGGRGGAALPDSEPIVRIRRR